MIGPGAVVYLGFPGVTGTKDRPAVVVSSDAYHSARPDIIVGLLTTQLADAVSPTDYVLQDRAATGLHHPSAFRAFLATRPANQVRQVIGQLTDRDWQEVRARVRLALALA